MPYSRMMLRIWLEFILDYSNITIKRRSVKVSVFTMRFKNLKLHIINRALARCLIWNENDSLFIPVKYGRFI